MELLPQLVSPRLRLRLLEPADADRMVAFRMANRKFLEPWEPKRPPEFFTPGFWYVQARANLREFRSGTSLCLAVFTPDESEVLGVCNYTNIVRGTFMACHLGYALSEAHQGKGLMFEALSLGNAYVFDSLGLNRIMANYLPRNDRSGRLLARLGFTVEGRASNYLMINGKWEDHILTSLVNQRRR